MIAFNELISLIFEKFSSFIHSETKSRIKKLIFSFRFIIQSFGSFGTLYNTLKSNKKQIRSIIYHYFVFLKTWNYRNAARVAFTRKSLYHVRWPSRNLRNRRINRTKSPFSVLSNILPPPPLLSGIRLILNSSISRFRFATTRNQSTPVPRENVGPESLFLLFVVNYWS